MIIRWAWDLGSPTVLKCQTECGLVDSAVLQAGVPDHMAVSHFSDRSSQDSGVTNVSLSPRETWQVVGRHKLRQGVNASWPPCLATMLLFISHVSERLWASVFFSVKWGLWSLPQICCKN